jgi:predicted permease
MMPLTPRLRSLWRNLFRKARNEQELDDELNAYLELMIDSKMREGLDSVAARREALIELGGKQQIKEQVGDVRIGHFIETFGQDLRYGLRMLRRNPVFAIVVVLTLGLGVGANTAIFSLVDAVLLKTLPVRDPEQLALLGHISAGKPITPFAYRTYKQLRDQNQVFSGLLAYLPLRMNVKIGDEAEPAVAGQLVSGNYFSVLGVNAALGRLIEPKDDRAPGESAVCVLSHDYWRRRFAGAPDVIGKSITLGGSPFIIIGVTPPEFFGLEIGGSMDISVPIMMQRQVMAGVRSYIEDQNSADNFKALGRLRPGVVMTQAQAGLSLTYQQICAEYAAANWGGQKFGPRPWLEEKITLEAGGKGLSELRRQFSRPLLILMIVVALVLAVACANAAGLLLARAVARRREIAIRLALGVGRMRLVRQLLTESFLLGGLGGVAGLILAFWGTSLLTPLFSQGEIAAHLNLTPDLRILGFTALAAGLTSALFGLAPAFLATRVNAQTVLKNDATGFAGGSASLGVSAVFGRLFVVSQIALSLLLLIGAGLFVRSLQKLQQVDAGFVRENVMVLKLEPLGGKSPELAARYDELLDHVKSIPGVKTASLVGYSPMSRREWLVLGQNPELRSPITVQGYTPKPGEDMAVPWMEVYPNSFSSLGIPLLAGRDFGPQDNQQWKPRSVCPVSARAPQVGIINESLARRFFGNENPIGRRFGPALSTGRCFIGDPEPDPAIQIEIVGVVKDVKYTGLRNEGREMYYLPFHQATSGFAEMTLVVRAQDESTGINAVAAAIRREARALDPVMPMFEIETLSLQVADSLREERLLAALSSGFGLLALLLSSLGLYGILSYAVAQRTKEIGVRMALGAGRNDVLWLVMRDALKLAILGVAIGLPASLAAGRLLSSQLFGISAADPATIIAAAFFLLVVAILAGYLPARRATRVDPITALRYE